MAPSSCSFENFESLHFNPFHNESFSDTEDERYTDENFFNELNTQKFECSYLFPNEIESFLSEKENSETINAIHMNIRSLSKHFDNLLDILRDSRVLTYFVLLKLKLGARIQPLKVIQICISRTLTLFHKKEKQTSVAVVC